MPQVSTATPGISVVIPTYNRLGRVEHAIESVLSQHLPAQEIIVVDDGSDDGTAETLRQRYPSITLLSQSNHGVSHARNRGIERASSEWIALLDSDDLWHPEKLLQQIAALQQSADVALVHCNEEWIRNGVPLKQKRRHQKYGGQIFAQCLPLCAISPSAALIKRSLLLALGGFDESLPACEDYDLWLRITVQETVLFVDQPLVIKHGGHADQLSQKYWGMDRFRLQALAKLLRSGRASATQRQQALVVFTRKFELYCAGALKRGKHDDVQALQQQYADLLAR